MTWNDINSKILGQLQEQFLANAEKILVMTNSQLTSTQTAKSNPSHLTDADLMVIAPIVSNKVHGFFAASMCKETALNLGRSIYPEEIPEYGDIAIDAVSELFNQIFGNSKQALNQHDFNFEMTPYQKIMGNGQQFYDPQTQECLVIPSTINHQPLDFILVVKKYEPKPVSKVTKMTAISVFDIDPDKPLPFNIYLNLGQNQKTILYRRQGEPFEEKKLNRFRNYQIMHLYIESEAYEHFINYNAENLLNLINADIVPEAKRTEALVRKVKHMVRNMFLDSSNTNEMLNGSVEVLLRVVSQGQNLKNAFDHLVQDHAKFYDYESHCLRVSGFSIILGICLGFNSPATLQNIASSALLHDVGFSELPIELFLKPRYLFTPEERIQYESHPQLGVEVIKNKNLKVAEPIRQIIFEHHERFDGEGFPRKVKLSPLTEICQIISFADEFDNIKLGKVVQQPMNNQEIVNYIYERNEKTKVYSPKLLKSIVQLIHSSFC